MTDVSAQSSGAVNDTLSFPSGAVHRSSSPLSASRQMPSTTHHRRASSAPNLRSSSAFASRANSGRPGSSGSSRSSFSHREGWLSEANQLGPPHPPPLAPIHERSRSRRSAFDPITPPTPQPAPAPPPNVEDEVSQNMEVMARRLEEIRRTLSMRERRHRGPSLHGLWVAARGWFGHGPEGTAARRELVSLTGKLLFGTVQIIATITLLSIGAHRKSPTEHSLNEWQACQRPLGAWCSIWVIRVVLGCFMALWGHRRKSRRLAEASGRVDHHEPPTGGSSSHAEMGAVRAPRPPANRRRDNTYSPQTRPPGTRRDNVRSAQAQANQHVSAAAFSRLTTLLSLLSLTWFITAHVLTYTSIHTCRYSSPHIWWLAFSIICIGYLVIVEVVVVAFLVFIIGPLIFVLINIILICMGRRPLRHPSRINPEIGKLSQKAVDQIPLVLYIPAPKQTPSNVELSQHSSPPQDTPVSTLALPEPVHLHSYPPDSERAPVSNPPEQGTRVRSRSRVLFTFRRIRLKRPRHKDEGKNKEGKQGKTSNMEHEYRYEDKWEKGEYPFVKLEDNRAACAICLCDFDEPRRIRYSLDSTPPKDLDEAEKGPSGDATQGETEGPLKLTDAGEGAQPLRLLDCAHVFHKTCLDPWLIEVSGRCPVCQRPVEVKEPKNGRTTRERGGAR